MIDLEDRLDILDMYARQAHRIDGGDAAGWASTFTEDGSFESPTYGLTAVGREALRDFAAASNGAALARGEQLRHHASQIVIDAIAVKAGSAASASVTSYLLIVATTTAGSRIDRSARMFDEVRKVDGQWLVASRSVTRDDAGLKAADAAADLPARTR
jgi:SnoaL-like domain